MSTLFPVPDAIAAAAHVDAAGYTQMYDRSVADPEGRGEGRAFGARPTAGMDDLSVRARPEPRLPDRDGGVGRDLQRHLRRPAEHRRLRRHAP